MLRLRIDINEAYRSNPFISVAETMKVGLVWCFTVIANCVSVKYIKVNTIAFRGNPTVNSANVYGYMEFKRETSKPETFRNVAKRSTETKRQRYDVFMADVIARHGKAVAMTTSLAGIVTVLLIAAAVAASAILQCSLCYDQFLPDNTIL